MAKKGSVLYIDQYKEVRELVNELMEKSFNLRTFSSLDEAESFLKDSEIAGMLIDGMFKQKELLDFVERAKIRVPDLPVAVLMPAVDMVLEPEFKKTLEKLGVKVVSKTEALRYERREELFKWCASQKMGG